MRVRAINAVSGIHGKERVQMVQDFQSHQERMKGLQEVPPPKRPLADNVHISPTEAARVLDQSAFSEEFLQDNSSGTSIMATSRDVNLLAQADAISQEMLSNLKASMSQSGYQPEDIVLPERKLSAASSRIDTLNNTEPLPPAPPPLFEPSPLSEAIQMESGALPQALPPGPVPTSNEEAVSVIPVDNIFTPNRTNALPKIQPPADVSYIHDQQELERLRQQQETNERVQTIYQDNEGRIRRPEEFLEKQDIPPPAVEQPIQLLGEKGTGILAVEEPEKLMAPDQKDPIQDLRQSLTSDILASLGSRQV